MSAKLRNFSPWAYWSLHLRAVRDADPFPTDVEELDAWRARVRARLTQRLGPVPQVVPLDFEITDTVDRGDYVQSRIVYDTEATMSVPAYLLVPTDRSEPGPAVLAVHGHGPGKDLICGITGPPHEHYAVQLVRLGYVVLAPDLRCFGERQDPQWDPDTQKYDCDWNLVAASMAGVNPLMQNLWDLQRSVDVLVAHPLVDANRIGAAGVSYGATMTMFLASLDARVRAAIVSGYLSSWRAAHAVPWNMCGSQVMFGQLGDLEHVDVAALISPRALLVESGTDDPLFPVAAAAATVAQLRRVWDHDGAPSDSLRHDIFDGDHRWYGTNAAAFLSGHL
jgi:dienelactone hydrolase